MLFKLQKMIDKKTEFQTKNRSESNLCRVKLNKKKAHSK